MQKIGLFFGTFNPIHIGHLQLACYFADNTDLDCIWFVITAQSPFKQGNKILPNQERLALVSRAISAYPKLEVSTIEFELPQPNYTLHTLSELKKQFPQNTFSLLLGADNISAFDQWKAYDQILANYKLYIYPRKTKTKLPDEFLNHPKVIWSDAPKIEISSSQIRKRIKEGKDVSSLIPEASYDYLMENNFYHS